MAAGGCDCATGAGFLRTRMMAISDATSVVMLIMRSILNFFMATLERSAQDRQAHNHGIGLKGRGLDDQSDGPGNKRDRGVEGLGWDFRNGSLAVEFDFMDRVFDRVGRPERLLALGATSRITGILPAQTHRHSNLS